MTKNNSFDSQTDLMAANSNPNESIDLSSISEEKLNKLKLAINYIYQCCADIGSISESSLLEDKYINHLHFNAKKLAEYIREVGQTGCTEFSSLLHEIGGYITGLKLNNPWACGMGRLKYDMYEAYDTVICGCLPNMGSNWNDSDEVTKRIIVILKNMTSQIAELDLPFVELLQNCEQGENVYSIHTFIRACERLFDNFDTCEDACKEYCY